MLLFIFSSLQRVVFRHSRYNYNHRRTFDLYRRYSSPNFLVRYSSSRAMTENFITKSTGTSVISIQSVLTQIATPTMKSVIERYTGLQREAIWPCGYYTHRWLPHVNVRFRSFQRAERYNKKTTEIAIDTTPSDKVRLSGRNGRGLNQWRIAPIASPPK